MTSSRPPGASCSGGCYVFGVWPDIVEWQESIGSNATDATSCAKRQGFLFAFRANSFAAFAFQICLLSALHLSALYDSALALVYPQACAVCGGSVESRRDGVACATCWNATSLLASDDTLCWKCGAFSRARISEDRRRNIRCGECDEAAFTAARACGFYEGALRASVLFLKREPRVAPRLARLMFATQQREPINYATLIVPVPLHAHREHERGFNQAALLARGLAQMTQLPLDEHSVVRRVHTERHRAGMDASARRKSVADAFAVRRPEIVAGQRVLLVDDVFTTGATVSSCAAALKDAGAEEVFVLTIARPQEY